MKTARADQLAAEQLTAGNLELARALIMEGRVLFHEQRVEQTGAKLPVNTVLRLKGTLDNYVSRGAFKLKKALEVFKIDLTDRIAIDVGASTGGFTDVMLRAGASKVYAVDVGYNQLHYTLRSDPRVTVMERTNARFLEPIQFPERPSFGATDVSFISLKAVLPAALNVLDGPDRRFVALVKPQFEAPKELVGEKGVVRDPAVHAQVLQDMIRFIPQLHWFAQDVSYSPIRGPEGNIEFLLDLCPEESAKKCVGIETISQTIQEAYDKILKTTNQGL